MSTIAQLVADISAAPAPVVFLDTCAILDVARAPARAQPDSVSAASDLVRLAGQSPPLLYLLVADIVSGEWTDNVVLAREELTKALSTSEHVARVVYLTGAATYLAASPRLANLPTELETRSRTLLDTCRVIDRDDAATNAAFDRVVAKRRPSHKKEVKDSYILEHCLAVARSLGGTAFSQWLLFVSSNIKDFANPGSTDIHTDLAGDFATAGMRYAVTLASAIAMLRSAGQIP